MRNDGQPNKTGMSLVAGVVLLLATGATAATAEGKKGPLKVFVLAGQSNMEGPRHDRG